MHARKQHTTIDLTLEVETNGYVFVQQPVEMAKLRNKVILRKFFISPDFSHLCWTSRAKGAGDSFIRISDIIDVK